MKSPELEQLLAGLRQGGPDLTAAPTAVRAAFEAMLANVPVAPDIRYVERRLGSLPVLESVTPGAGSARHVLYFHGGAYVFGSAAAYRSLSAEIGRACEATVLSVDYRLAPEHPHPAAVDDAVAAWRALLQSGIDPAGVAVAGDSAGGGLALALLVAARDAGLPLPAAAWLLSPWVDLACTGDSMRTKAADDPALARDSLLGMAAHYLQRQPATLPLASPLHADLAGLPPLLLQVGSAEVLLDDATRLAARAAAAGVRVTLSAWPDMPHVWQLFSFLLPEARAALAEGGAFLRRELR